MELLLLDGVLLFSGDVFSGLVLRVMSIWVLFFAAFLSFWLFSLFGGMYGFLKSVMSLCLSRSGCSAL